MPISATEVQRLTFDTRSRANTPIIVVTAAAQASGRLHAGDGLSKRNCFMGSEGTRKSGPVEGRSGGRRRGRPPHRKSQRGFSLFEMILAVACLAGLTALAVTSLAPATDRMRLRAEVREIASLLGAARTRAIMTGQVTTVELDARGNSIISGEPAMIRQLPPQLSLRVTGGGETSDRQRMVFYPEGSASGGAFSVADRHRQITASVDWLTGRITIDAEVVDGH